MTLNEYGLKYGTDQSSIHHDFLNRMAPFFAPLRDLACEIVEIGVAGGAGTQTLRDYFHNATVFGVDHNPATELLQLGPRIRLVPGEASDKKFWNDFSRDTGPWAICVDDAGHHSSQIITTFDCVWPYIRPGGFYVIEDLHSAGYDPAYNRDGGPTAMQFIHLLIDAMNEHGKNNCGKPTTASIDSIHLSKSLAIIKKR